jgi:hypothetical protein
MTQLIQAALNGPSMTIEELSDVGNAAMSEFEGLRGGEQTALAFVQSGKGVTHRLLHRPRILGNHRGFLPRAKNPCLGHPDYRPNRVPKRPNATVNKFRALSEVAEEEDGMDLRFWVDPEMTNEKKETYPAGWDEARIRKLAEHYDNQTEDEQVAEHEAAFLAEGQTVMVVPSELVPEIVRLIREKRPA